MDSWKGITTDRLVFNINDLEMKIGLLDTTPLTVIEFGVPQGWTKERWIEDNRQSYRREIASIQREIVWRRKKPEARDANAEIIQAIKNAVRIEDVLEKYTDVIVSGGQWKYRCTLHGTDKHPSGSIRRDEQKAHCFVCNLDGDIFDVVQWFERCELPQAIAILANMVGLDTKPLVPQGKHSSNRWGGGRKYRYY